MTLIRDKTIKFLKDQKNQTKQETNLKFFRTMSQEKLETRSSWLSQKPKPTQTQFIDNP